MGEKDYLMELEYDTLDEFLKEKARMELGEREEEIEDHLMRFIDMVKGIEGLNCNMNKNFLLQFLRAKKYNFERAKETLIRYYRHRKDYPHFYKYVDPKVIRSIMDINFLYFSPWRTNDGCSVLIYRPGTCDPSIYDFETMFSYAVLCFQKIAENPVMQVCGEVVIADFSDLSFEHMKIASPTRIRVTIAAFQEILPYRLKGLHVINNNRLFGILFAMMKPFLKEKIKNRVFLHGVDSKSLHQYVPREALPVEYGGMLQSFGNDDFYNSVLQSHETYNETQKFGFS